MGLTIDRHRPSGVFRIIDERSGRVDTMGGYQDKSLLHVADRVRNFDWRDGGLLKIRGIEQQLQKLEPKGANFMGLEDPDLLFDADGRVHLYFTIAFRDGRTGRYLLFLGHASGDDLENFNIEPPVMSPMPSNTFIKIFKELCPAPINSAGTYLHLVESNSKVGDITYSTVAVIEARGMGGVWEFRNEVLHPSDMGSQWCAGHVSPCRLLPKEFINHGDLLVGVLNGREANGKNKFGKFRPGLFLYNPETGEVPWVDDQPLFDDPHADTIVFASDFEQTSPERGILYAHVDDAYINAYRIDSVPIMRRLPATV
jgi:hypothetical protein